MIQLTASDVEKLKEKLSDINYHLCSAVESGDNTDTCNHLRVGSHIGQAIESVVTIETLLDTKELQVPEQKQKANKKISPLMEETPSPWEEGSDENFNKPFSNFEDLVKVFEEGIEGLTKRSAR